MKLFHAGQAGVFDAPVYKVDLSEPYLQVGGMEYEIKSWQHLLEHDERIVKLAKETDDLLKKWDEERPTKDMVESREIGIKEKKQRIAEMKPATTHDWYEMCCDKTLSNLGAGVIPGGVVSSSGFGDGGYSACFATNDAGEIVSVEINFIEAEEEGGDDDDDYEEEEEEVE